MIVTQLPTTELDRVEPLWRTMVEHHRGLEAWPVRDASEAWRRRRAQYERWLAAEDRAWLLAAASSTDRDAPLLGYAVVAVGPGGPTWDLGEDVGELESLAVLPGHRGEGVGAALTAAARDLLRSRGVRYWTVGVVEDNAGAVRFYEREGFRAFYRQLLAPLDGG